MSVKSAKRPAFRKLLPAAAAIVAVAAFDQPAAYAGNGFLGGFVGGVVGGVLGHMLVEPRYRYAPSYRSEGRPSRSRNASGASGGAPQAPPSPADSSRALASLAPPTTQQEQAMLKSITPSQSLGAVGASDDLNQIGRDDNAEAGRDYTSRIDDLIKRIQVAQNTQHSTKEGDVTEHAILEALEGSIRDAKLTTFETFLGENWSPERLRVMILDRVENEIGGLFDGTNRGAVTMNDLDLMIKKAATNVYARLFETSELLASNRSSTLFVQRLYQTHGDLVNGEIRESAEQLLAEAYASALDKDALEPLLRRDPNAFALRYRAQRIVYDCLTDGVDETTSNESGMGNLAEIRNGMLKLAETECANWVSKQLTKAGDKDLDDKIAKGEPQDRKITPQDPMPLRVIWTTKGPTDDASMYGRATD
jgi:hypothetical protein